MSTIEHVAGKHSDHEMTTNAHLWQLIAAFEVQRNIDLEWLLGLSPAQIGEMRRSGNEHIEMKGLSRAAIVRYLLEHPEAWPLPRSKTPQELYERIRTFMDLSRNELGVLLGRSAVSGQRWVSGQRQDDGVSPDIDRLILLIDGALDRAGHDKAKCRKVVEEFMEIMIAEAESRGYDIQALIDKGRWQR